MTTDEMTTDEGGEKGEGSGIVPKPEKHTDGHDVEPKQETSGPDEPTDKRENAAGAERHAKRRYGRRTKAYIRRNGRSIEVLSTAVIACFTVALWFTSNRQQAATEAALRETRESNQLTRWNVETTLRPWIMVDDWTWVGTDATTLSPPPPLVGADVVAVRIAVKNTGQLPATGVYGMVAAMTLPLNARFPKEPR